MKCEKYGWKFICVLSKLSLNQFSKNLHLLYNYIDELNQIAWESNKHSRYPTGRCEIHIRHFFFLIHEDCLSSDHTELRT